MRTQQVPFAVNTMQLAILNSGLLSERKIARVAKPKKFRKAVHKCRVVGYRLDVVTGEKIGIVERTN